MLAPASIIMRSSWRLMRRPSSSLTMRLPLGRGSALLFTSKFIGSKIVVPVFNNGFPGRWPYLFSFLRHAVHSFPATHLSCFTAHRLRFFLLSLVFLL